MDYLTITNTIRDSLNISSHEASLIYSKWKVHRDNIEDDLNYLSNVSPRDLESYVDINVRHEGMDHILWAQQQKRGVVFLSAHYACFYWMLFAKGASFNEVIITRLEHDDRSKAIISNIENIVPMNLPNVKANASAVPRIYKSLKKGGATYAMFDFYSKNGPFVLSELLGKEVASPCTLLSLAYRNKSVIVPVFCFSESNRKLITSEAPIDPKQFNGSEEEFVYDSTLKMHELISNYIHKYPEQWQLWDNLEMRWDFARQFAN